MVNLEHIAVRIAEVNALLANVVHQPKDFHAVSLEFEIAIPERLLGIDLESYVAEARRPRADKSSEPLPSRASRRGSPACMRSIVCELCSRPRKTPPCSGSFSRRSNPRIPQ